MGWVPRTWIGGRAWMVRRAGFGSEKANFVVTRNSQARQTCVWGRTVRGYTPGVLCKSAETLENREVHLTLPAKERRRVRKRLKIKEMCLWRSAMRKRLLKNRGQRV